MVQQPCCCQTLCGHFLRKMGRRGAAALACCCSTLYTWYASVYQHLYTTSCRLLSNKSSNIRILVSSIQLISPISVEEALNVSCCCCTNRRNKDVFFGRTLTHVYIFSFLCMLYNAPLWTSLHIGCGCFGCTLTTVSSQITSACHNFADTEHYACHMQHVGQTYRLSVCKKSL